MTLRYAVLFFHLSERQSAPRRSTVQAVTVFVSMGSSGAAFDLWALAPGPGCPSASVQAWAEHFCQLLAEKAAAEGSPGGVFHVLGTSMGGAPPGAHDFQEEL